MTKKVLKNEEKEDEELPVSTSNKILSPDIMGQNFQIRQGYVEISGLLFPNRHYVMTYFESITGWTSLILGSGANTARLGSLYLKTGLTINSRAGIANDNLSVVIMNFINKDSVFVTTLAIPTLTGSAFDSYFGVGELLAGGETDQGYGFRVLNDVLYSYVEVAGVQVTTPITGITLGNSNVYSAKNNTSKRIVTFYVNGELKTSMGANFGLGANETRFVFYITNTAASNREVYINHAIYAQNI